MVFDIKMKGYRQKAKIVTGSHMMEALSTIVYASVVLREAVKITLMITTLNYLEVKCQQITTISKITQPVMI